MLAAEALLANGARASAHKDHAHREQNALFPSIRPGRQMLQEEGEPGETGNGVADAAAEVQASPKRGNLKQEPHERGRVQLHGDAHQRDPHRQQADCHARRRCAWQKAQGLGAIDREQEHHDND